jgi:hypothetical protein
VTQALKLAKEIRELKELVQDQLDHVDTSASLDGDLSTVDLAELLDLVDLAAPNGNTGDAHGNDNGSLVYDMRDSPLRAEDRYKVDSQDRPELLPQVGPLPNVALFPSNNVVNLSTEQVDSLLSMYEKEQQDVEKEEEVIISNFKDATSRLGPGPSEGDKVVQGVGRQTRSSLHEIDTPHSHNSTTFDPSKLCFSEEMNASLINALEAVRQQYST